MRSIFTRIIGAALALAAGAGMLFSLFGIVQTWRVRPVLVNGLVYELDLLRATVDTTSVGLTTISDTLKTASGNVQVLQDTTAGLTQSLHEAQPMLDTLVRLLGHDLPNTITATQISLDSAAASALLIDNIMGSITNLPLLGLDKYAPEVPLHTALGNVSSNLGAITPGLTSLQANLAAVKVSMGNVEVEVAKMGGDVEQMVSNMEAARQVIAQYQQESELLLAQVESAKKNLPAWITSLAWFLTIALVWLFITQIGLLIKGWEMLALSVRPVPTE
jgi:hypothetical protein